MPITQIDLEIFETDEQRGIQRERAFSLRLMSRRLGAVPQDLRSTLELLSID